MAEGGETIDSESEGGASQLRGTITVHNPLGVAQCAHACPNSPVMSTNSVRLSQALSILREEGTNQISLAGDDLWRSCSLDGCILTAVKQYFIRTQWLYEQGEWDSICGEEINRNQFTVLGEDGSEVKSFPFFSHLFNAVLEYLRQNGHGTPVERMFYAGAVGPESTACTRHRPDAFLQLNTGASPAPSKFTWRDLAGPFEYKLGDGDPLNVNRPDSVTLLDRALTLPERRQRIAEPLSHCAL